MATIIDALIVTLGLDAKGFKQGQKETGEALDKTKDKADKANKALQEQAKKSEAAFRKFRNEVLGLATAFIGMSALKSFTDRLTASDAALGRTARNVNMTARELSAWQGVAERSGGSADDMAGSIKNLTGQFQTFSLTGQAGAAIPYFRALGIAISDADGKMRPMQDILMDVSKAFQGMDPAKAQALGAGMGFGEGTVNTLIQGPAALRAMLAEQLKLNALNEADAKAAQEREKAWKETVQAATDLGRKILTDITPALTTIAEILRSVFVFLKENKGLAEGIGIALLSVGALKFGVLLSSIAAVSGGLAGAVGSAAMLVRYLGAIGLAGGAGYAVGTGISGGLDWLLSKLSGKSTSLGGAIYDAFNADPMAGGSTGGRRVSGKVGSTGGGDSLAALERQYGLPAGLLDAVWQQESGRGKNMRSPAGAKGHFQFMAATARQYGIEGREDDFGASSQAAARMYSDLMRKYGDLPTALAAYNWGQGNVDRKGMGAMPAETRGYVSSIMRNMGAGSQYGSARTSTSTTDVSIGSITVNTQATDAAGVAKGLAPAIGQYTFASQANAGLN